METPGWLVEGSSDPIPAAREAAAGWAQVAKPQGDPPFFEYGAAPPFDHATPEYSDGNAWWLSELCRLAYTRVSADSLPPGVEPVAFDDLARVGIEPLRSFHHAGWYAGLFKLKRSTGGRPGLAVVFRGTPNVVHGILNLSASAQSWYDENPDDPAWVHQGFKRALDVLWPDVEEALGVARFPVFYTGHGLGGGVATLAAARLQPVALYTFGSPRVGNGAFHELVVDQEHHRLVYGDDLVPTIPQGVNLRGGILYQHTGVLHHFSPEGELTVDPKPENRDPERWESDEPFRALGKAFSQPEHLAPPQAMLDHAPIHYTRVLVSRLMAARRPFYPHYGERESVA